MKNWLLRILLGSLGALTLFLPVTSWAAHAFPGHRTFSPSDHPWAGRHLASAPMRLSIALSLRDPEGLRAFLHDVYDPQSPQYRSFLSSAQFADRFGPTPSDYQALQDRLASQGLRVTTVFSNRMMLDVEGPTEAVEKAFHVRINDFRRPDGSLFFGPDQDPSTEVELPIVHVGGLDNAERPRPRLRKFPRTASPRAGGTGLGGAFIGSDYRNAYAPGVTLTGAGQSLALVEFTVYTPAEITTYEGKCAPPLSVPVSNIYLGGFTSSTAPDCKAADSYPEIEVALDIEVAMAMAPGLDKVFVYMEGGTTSDVLNHIASDNNCRQISCSWGWTLTSTERTAQNNTLAEFAAQGQSYFLAAGDGNPNTGVGAFTTDPPYGGNPSTNSNANDALILQTTVGATDLTMSGGAYVSEAAISITSGWQSTGGILTGTRSGDSLATYAAYQGGINMTANHGSTVYRNVPDVSCAGLNCYVYDCTGDDNVGGTSAATPLWAAYMALVNQQASLSGKGPVGFPNPALYTIAKGPQYNSDFNDITTGNNGSATQFPAVTGFDLATGWGSPKGQSLINDLVAWIPTATPTSTPSRTPTVTPTFSPTRTPTQTSSATPTSTPTLTATSTVSTTATSSPSATASQTPTSSPTATGTFTASRTATPTPTDTATSTASSTPTSTASLTATKTASSTSTDSSTSTPTPSPTNSSTQTPTATSSRTATSSMTSSATASQTQTPSSTATGTASLTPSSTASSTATGTASFTASKTPTATATDSATATATLTATSSATNSSTATATSSPTNSSTQTLTATASRTATDTATSSMTSTASLTASSTASSTATGTASSTASKTPTSTATDSATATATLTATSSATDSPTSTATLTLTDSPTRTATSTSTNSPTATSTFTATETGSSTASSTPTRTPSSTASGTSTSTSTNSATPTASFTATSTDTNSSTSTATATPTDSPTMTATSTGTETPSSTASSTPTFTQTLTSTGTLTKTDTPTSTYSWTPSPTPTATWTFSDTSTPTNSSTATLTSTSTESASSTASPTTTNSASATPSFTPTATASWTSTITATPTFTSSLFSTLTPTPSLTFTPTPPPGFFVAAVPNVSSEGDLIQFRVSLPSAGKIILCVYDVAGECVDAVQVQGSVGVNNIPWAVKDQYGNALATGIYIYYVQIGDGSSGEKAIGKVFVKH